MDSPVQPLLPSFYSLAFLQFILIGRLLKCEFVSAVLNPFKLIVFSYLGWLAGMAGELATMLVLGAVCGRL